MASHLLTDDLTIEGSWWIPGSDHHVAGTFDFSLSRTELRLHGDITNSGQLMIDIPSEPIRIIHGTLLTGEAVSLINCHVIGQSLSMGSGGTSTPITLMPNYAVFGCWLDENDKFPSMSFRIPSLCVWYAKQFLFVDTPLPIKSGQEVLSKCEVRLGDDTSVYVKKIESNIKFGASCSVPSMPAITKAGYEIFGWTQICPDEPQDIQWFLQQQFILSVMLAMISGETMFPDLVESSVIAKELNAQDKESKISVSILFSESDAKICTTDHPWEFLLSMPSLGPSFSDMVEKWFAVYPKVKEPSNLSISIFSSENLWLHVEFQSLMQALEGYHRALFDGDYMAKEEYDAVYTLMTNSIPNHLSKPHRTALKSRLKYGNQISLRTRLKKLIELLSADVRQKLFGDIDKFIKNIVDTRNYYSHWDEELLPDKLDTQGMYEANIRLRLFLRILYLHLIGVDMNQVLRLFESHHPDALRLRQI